MTDGNNHQRWSRPRDEALDAVYFESAAALDEGSQFPSLTYEDGAKATIKCVLGRGPNPLEE